MKRFDSHFFQHLSEQSVSSSRRRSNANVHTDYQDPIQRLFITIQPDSYVCPHRHTEADKWECFIIIDGALSILLFDDEGSVTERIELRADSAKRGVEIPQGVWHAVVPGENPSTFFEVKPGPYMQMSDKDFAAWAPREGDAAAQQYLHTLKSAKVGDVPRAI
ncbi:WbuC family cupin fold metalloprotein [Aestuariibacter salexigens]|uniref:WbuC family cupin fold metalloprotein n=1 Tax=Aestuariibacter salexigens TaxID=226010 RepID=UPI0004205600|nr:WbuC family cupin fold metalloprotein [Aestuariibacter salexigens]